MHAILTIIGGAHPHQLLLRLPTLIGRSLEADLKVGVSTVSRQHCEIYEFEHELVVNDLGSSNGTFVNDERIEGPTFLSPGDELRVGGVTFRADYELPESPAVAPRSSSLGDGLPIESEFAALTSSELSPQSSHIQMTHTDQGSFIAIEEEVAEAPDDSKLNEFLQGLG
ncbi:MAG: FHA domain-containing protein [Planctomycetota bacterium]